MTQSHNGFNGLGINRRILDILTRLQFTEPTPIQHKTIPIGIEGKDIIGIAQTGTGKTLAFGIPVIQHIGSTGGHGLVVVPTRELALQVNAALQDVGRQLGLRTAVIIGGESMQKQLQQLRAHPHLIIATPGRLLDHMEQKTVSLIDISVLVLDEADRMLDMGFAPQIKRILQAVPQDRQTLLFSATMPTDIVRLAGQYMKLPVRIEVAPSGTAAERVEHELFFVAKPDKFALLEKLLADYHGTVLVFTRTKFGAKKTAAMLRKRGYHTSELHSNRSLHQRRESLEGFKKGKYRILVATDIAARGIDVQDIALVVNYDLPEKAEDYVHRIGRTGRAGKAGKAISFATPDQQRDVRDIERLIRLTIPVTRVAGGSIPRPMPQHSEVRQEPARREPTRPYAPRERAEHPSRHTWPSTRPYEHSERHAARSFGNPHGRRPAPFHSDNRQFFGPGAPNYAASSERAPRRSPSRRFRRRPRHGGSRQRTF